MNIIKITLRKAQLHAVMFSFSGDKQRCIGFFVDPKEALMIANLPIGKENGKGFVQEVFIEVDENNLPLRNMPKIYPTAIACACDNLTYNKCRQFHLLPD